MDRFDDAARRATYEACLRVLGRSPAPDDYVPVIAKALRDAHRLGADEAHDGVESEATTLRAELAAARAEVGEAWFVGGVTLAEAIRAKTAFLERLAESPEAEADRG